MTPSQTTSHPEAEKAKAGLTLAGGAITVLGLPFVLMALRVIGGIFQYILAASGIAFMLGFLGYWKFRGSRK